MPNIKLKGQTGEVLTYEDVKRVYFDSADQDGEVVYYTHGVATSKTVEPDFASGDMNVPIVEGELVTELTIEQPDTLLPENVRHGIEVAGVTGDFIGDTEEVTVDLDMAEGGQVITPSAETKVLSKVVVTKPGTMVPENIRAGTDIGGVVGEFSGDTEEVTVDLDFSEGDQVIEPTAAGKSIIKATITKPEALIPENIAKDVEIGGVVGNLSVEGTTKEIEPDFSAGDQTVTAEEDELWNEVILKMPETLLAGNIVNGVNIAGVTGTFKAPKIVVKTINGSTATSGTQTLLAADELASIDFENATKKFVLLFDVNGSVPTTTSWNVLTFNFICYPYLLSSTSTSNTFYGYTAYRYKNGNYNQANTPTYVMKSVGNPWEGAYSNSMFYENGAIVYDLASTYHLSLSSTVNNTYCIVAGCY